MSRVNHSSDDSQAMWSQNKYNSPVNSPRDSLVSEPVGSDDDTLSTMSPAGSSSADQDSSFAAPRTWNEFDDVWPDICTASDGPSEDRIAGDNSPNDHGQGHVVLPSITLGILVPAGIWVPAPCSIPTKDTAGNCEICGECVAQDQAVVMLLPQGKRVYRDSSLDTQEAKKCHEKCLPSRNLHPEACKPCIDWNRRGKCRKEFNCEFCHLPHEEIARQGPRLQKKERAKKLALEKQSSASETSRQVLH